MITQGEINFVKELIVELATMADPSEYYEGEVEEAVELLDKLASYDLEHVMKVVESMNLQIKEITNE